MLSAKQQLSNIKHGEGIRLNVWVLTFGPLYIKCILILIELNSSYYGSVVINNFKEL